jgi:hypothetical protein
VLARCARSADDPRHCPSCPIAGSYTPSRERDPERPSFSGCGSREPNRHPAPARAA